MGSSTQPSGPPAKITVATQTPPFGKQKSESQVSRSRRGELQPLRGDKFMFSRQSRAQRFRLSFSPTPPDKLRVQKIGADALKRKTPSPAPASRLFKWLPRLHYPARCPKPATKYRPCESFSSDAPPTKTFRPRRNSPLSKALPCKRVSVTRYQSRLRPFHPDKNAAGLANQRPGRNKPCAAAASESAELSSLQHACPIPQRQRLDQVPGQSKSRPQARTRTLPPASAVSGAFPFPFPKLMFFSINRPPPANRKVCSWLHAALPICECKRNDS